MYDSHMEEDKTHNTTQIDAQHRIKALNRIMIRVQSMHYTREEKIKQPIRWPKLSSNYAVELTESSYTAIITSLIHVSSISYELPLIRSNPTFPINSLHFTPPPQNERRSPISEFRRSTIKTELTDG
ncbi:hypothetical protein AVEN_217611-1 [Araneus ventricosus]|uniref:Uncharacterized protein n=1 Tax=Araneus ventricosus TaxID=182803 RepID=A0A4Y2FHH7_ARAVE|nr:hypothetical protein AVEN_217611-1 [Araneus ventricosus]